MNIKFIIYLAVFLFTSFDVKAQNLLNKSEKEVKDYMSDQSVSYVGKKYTNDGVAFIEFQFSSEQSQYSGLSTLDFFLTYNNICTKWVAGYALKKYAEAVVEKIRTNSQFEKVEGTFKWINEQEKYSIEIKQNVDSEGFLVFYENI